MGNEGELVAGDQVYVALLGAVSIRMMLYARRKMAVPTAQRRHSLGLAS